MRNVLWPSHVVKRRHLMKELIWRRKDGKDVYANPWFLAHKGFMGFFVAHGENLFRIKRVERPVYDISLHLTTTTSYQTQNVSSNFSQTVDDRTYWTHHCCCWGWFQLQLLETRKFSELWWIRNLSICVCSSSLCQICQWNSKSSILWCQFSTRKYYFLK